MRSSFGPSSVAIAFAITGCSADRGPIHTLGVEASNRREEVAQSSAPPPSSPSSSLPSAQAARPDLPESDGFTTKVVFEREVVFLITGEKGRLAVLAKEGTATVPYRFEAARWQRLDLPEGSSRVSDPAKLGIYFGRDNRPRLMGYQEDGPGARMVYMRYKEGAWQDQRSEIGALASDSAALFGVLGEAEPEVVCKVGATCLLKSRKGWKEVKSTLPPTAVVRAFGGSGYALTGDGIYRADERGFSRVGPTAPWKSAATGFWVGADGAIAVAEPSANLIHTLENPSAVWSEKPSPIESPEDLAGPPDNRWVVGEGGLAHCDPKGERRVGEATWSFSRAILLDGTLVVGGRSGVVIAEAK